MAQDNRQDNQSTRQSQPGQSSQSGQSSESSQSSRDVQSQSRESQSKPSQSSSSFSGQQGSQQSSSQSGGNYSFRCADVGQKECSWETKGSSEDEVLRNVEKHGREKHDISSFVGDMRDRVRGAIKRVAA